MKPKMSVRCHFIAEKRLNWQSRKVSKATLPSNFVASWLSQYTNTWWDAFTADNIVTGKCYVYLLTKLLKNITDWSHKKRQLMHMIMILFINNDHMVSANLGFILPNSKCRGKYFGYDVNLSDISRCDILDGVPECGSLSLTLRYGRV